MPQDPNELTPSTGIGQVAANLYPGQLDPRLQASMRPYIPPQEPHRQAPLRPHLTDIGPLDMLNALNEHPALKGLGAASQWLQEPMRRPLQAAQQRVATGGDPAGLGNIFRILEEVVGQGTDPLNLLPMMGGAKSGGVAKVSAAHAPSESITRVPVRSRSAAGSSVSPFTFERASARAIRSIPKPLREPMKKSIESIVQDPSLKGTGEVQFGPRPPEQPYTPQARIFARPENLGSLHFPESRFGVPELTGDFSMSDMLRSQLKDLVSTVRHEGVHVLLEPGVLPESIRQQLMLKAILANERFPKLAKYYGRPAQPPLPSGEGGYSTVWQRHAGEGLTVPAEMSGMMRLLFGLPESESTSAVRTLRSAARRLKAQKRAEK